MIRIDPKIADTIIKRQHQKEIHCFSKNACRSIRGKRYRPHIEKIPDRSNLRPIFSHDADRIIHSLAYSRYIDKTQVFYLIENDHITHRVLHVQLVSKIARSIGKLLSLNEDLLEAIALGHDIGHSPYGHNGERYLQKYCANHKIGTFAHNVQSVRLLDEIENYGNGWNITLQVLDGILCHNGEIISSEYKPAKTKTWDDFYLEYRNCMDKIEASKKVIPMTLEACVVRISDVIAYIGRDFEDAIKLGLIKRGDLPKEASQVLGKENRKIIDSLVTDLLNNSYERDHLSFSKEVFFALNTMMKFNYEMIYQNPNKNAQDSKIEKMFEIVLSRYLNDLETKQGNSKIYNWAVNGFRRNYFNKTPKPRIVVDYVSGMTDDFLNNEYEEMIMPKSFGFDFKQLVK